MYHVLHFWVLCIAEVSAYVSLVCGGAAQLARSSLLMRPSLGSNTEQTNYCNFSLPCTHWIALVITGCLWRLRNRYFGHNSLQFENNCYVYCYRELEQLRKCFSGFSVLVSQRLIRKLPLLHWWVLESPKIHWNEAWLKCLVHTFALEWKHIHFYFCLVLIISCLRITILTIFHG